MLSQEVTLDNVEEYIECVTDFCLNSGIRRPMEAFRGEPLSVHTALQSALYSQK